MLTALHSSGTAIEHFARIIDSRRWQGVLIQMLTSCFDASGKTPSTTTKAHPKSTSKGHSKSKPVPDSRAMAVVGFASQAGMWVEFDLQWANVLSRYNVPFFHAGDFAYSRWPFDSGWKGEERKRRDFQSELMEVIQNCGLRKFGSLLWVADQNKAKATMGLSTDSTASPYVLCSRAAVEDLIAYAVREGQRENIEYIFEKGDEEDRLRQHFRKHSFHEPSFRWSKPVEKKGITQQPFMGLQAAGWIVWEYYLSFFRSFQEFFKHDIEGRWALRVFENHRQVPGEIKILYKSAPMMDFERQFRESFPDLFGPVSEATRRIEAAKREGIK